MIQSLVKSISRRMSSDSAHVVTLPSTQAAAVIEHVEHSIALATAERAAGLSDGSAAAQRALGVEGLIGTKNRHFLNALCGDAYPRDEGCRYVEIGTYRGASLCAAVVGNARVHATAVDSWEQFGGPRDEATDNAQACIPEGAEPVRFHEADFAQLNVKEELGVHDVLYYDAGHSEEQQYDAVVKLTEAAEDVAVLLVDDFSWRGVKRGTYRALADRNVPIAYYREVACEGTEMNGTGWWCGVAIIVIDKSLSESENAATRANPAYLVSGANASSLREVYMAHQGYRARTLPALRNLVSLETLDLSGNLLHRLPDLTMCMPELKTVNLSNNNFTDIPLLPPTITALHMDNNDLEQITPERLSRLPNLTVLTLAKNQLAELPSLTDLVELEELVVHSNCLTSLPASVGELPRLKSLVVNDNRLAAFPVQVLASSTIAFMSLRDNLFNAESIPENLNIKSAMSSIRTIFVESDCITAEQALDRVQTDESDDETALPVFRP